MNKNIERHLRNIRWLLSEVTTIQSSEDFSRIVARFEGLGAGIENEVKKMEHKIVQQDLQIEKLKMASGVIDEDEELLS